MIVSALIFAQIIVTVWLQVKDVGTEFHVNRSDILFPDTTSQPDGTDFRKKGSFFTS